MIKIALVEDDTTMGALLEALLGYEGFEVAHCSLGSEEEILTEIQALRPELILLDVHLKNADGIAIMKSLRAQNDLNTTRVIMTSGMAVGEDCLQAGADAFLMKPYMPSDLVALIRANITQ